MMIRLQMTWARQNKSSCNNFFFDFNLVGSRQLYSWRNPIYFLFRQKNERKGKAWRTHSSSKVIYPKYSKHWTCTMAFTKFLNHGVFFLSLFKLIPCLIHWIVCVFAYLKVIVLLSSQCRMEEPKRESVFIFEFFER